MKRISKMRSGLVGFAAILLASACSDMQIPTTAAVAVSGAAVENAEEAGGATLSPVEMSSARSNLALARKALANKDYERAAEFAKQADADAKLAQGKANSARAKLAATALQDDLRVLREELARSRK